jgi:hypothetical protein
MFALAIDNLENIPTAFSSLILTEYVVPSASPSTVKLVAG